MAFDLGRRSFGPTLIAGVWSREGLAGLWKLAKAALGFQDAEVAARFAALGELGEDTLGYALYHQFVDNGFAHPGQKHGPPDSLLFHDLGHVLSGYGTDPEGEAVLDLLTAFDLHRARANTDLFLLQVDAHEGRRIDFLRSYLNAITDFRTVLHLRRGAQHVFSFVDRMCSGTGETQASGQSTQD